MDMYNNIDENILQVALISFYNLKDSNLDFMVENNNTFSMY